MQRLPLCFLGASLGLGIVACSSSDGADETSDVGTDAASGGSATGGATAQGGAGTKGGTTGTGGAKASGGSSATGGAKGSGGSSGTGGATSSGGSTGTGGASLPPIRPCSGLGSATAGQWEDITPMPGSVWPMSSTMDPTGTLWVGGYGTAGPKPGHGGLYKSTDCGANWTHQSTGTNGAEIDRSDIWSMAVDLDSSGGEPNVYAIGMYGPCGLWKSTNGGVDWTQLMPAGDAMSHIAPAGPGNPPIAAIGSVVLDPTNRQHVIAGVHSTCADPYGPVCDLESTDGGATWRAVRVPVTGATGWQEQTGPYILGGSSWLHVTLGNGMWLTSDDGASFTNVVPPSVGGATGGEYTMKPLRPTASGAYYLPSNNPSGLVQSTDAGAHWSKVAGVPQSGNYYVAMAAAGGKVFLGDGYAHALLQADETSLGQWLTIPMPTPGADTSGGWGVWYLDYDPTNHLLYALVQNPWKWSSLYRMVVK